MDASGLNPSPDKDQPSTSRSPSDLLQNQTRPQILLIEDNRADVYLIRQAIRTANIKADLHVLHDGQAATKFFDGTDSDDDAPCLDLILLDLNLPKKSGADVLMHLRKSKRCRNAIVLIVTSSDSAQDREAVAALTVAGYFRKPSEYGEFMKLGVMVRELLAEPKSEDAG